MKTIGVIVLVVGVLAFLVGFNMDTTVAAGDYGLRRVHNIGLMNDRQNIIIFAGVLAVIGTLLFSLAGKNKQPSPIPEGNSSPSTGTRKCPFCAEFVKTEAVICRFCQKDLPPIPEIAPTPDITESNSTHLPSSDSTESLTSEQIQTMEEFGITYDGEKFHFHEYRYERLTDAVNYAKLQAGKK